MPSAASGLALVYFSSVSPLPLPSSRRTFGYTTQSSRWHIGGGEREILRKVPHSIVSLLFPKCSSGNVAGFIASRVS